MIDVIEERKCTGCKMCGDACQVEAVYFEEDTNGFWYPQVDYEKCVSCGECVEVCPSMNDFETEEYREPDVYAAWLKDEEMRRYSTSGGVYYALAKAILDAGGAVAACRFTDDWKHAEHILATNQEELMQTVRSKYFQSDTTGIYQKVKDVLVEGKRVLFCGAPCQSAALRKFLGKPYEKLITMDFICRGINSQKAFEAFVAEQEEKHNSKVSSVHLKNKRKGWRSLGVLMEFENGEEYYETRSNSYWSLGYIKENLYMRPVCHSCQYRTIPRISDFTIGDFWGIQNMKEEDLFSGISVLFVNSDRAQNILNELGTELCLEEHTLEEAIKGNPCILQSPEEGTMREKFFELLKNMKFSEAVAECCGKLGC